MPESVTSIGGFALGFFVVPGVQFLLLNRIVGFTLYGVKDSAAEDYAKKHNIKFLESGGNSGTHKKGHILGNPEVAIFDALEILKYLVNMDCAIKDGNAAFNAALITGDSAEPTIFDALEILKHLVNMPSKVEN